MFNKSSLKSQIVSKSPSTHVSQLGRRDESVAVLVKDPEGLADFLLAVCVLHLPGGRRGEGDRMSPYAE